MQMNGNFAKYQKARRGIVRKSSRVCLHHLHENRSQVNRSKHFGKNQASRKRNLSCHDPIDHGVNPYRKEVNKYAATACARDRFPRQRNTEHYLPENVKMRNGLISSSRVVIDRAVLGRTEQQQLAPPTPESTR
jgi:hypothetical protein